MHLVGQRQRRRLDAEGPGDPGPVLVDILRPVRRAEPDIEAGVNAVGDAALAGEEGVADGGHRVEDGGTDHRRPEGSWPRDSAGPSKVGAAGGAVKPRTAAAA